MNLIDLVSRKARCLTIGQNLPIHKIKHDNSTWRAVHVHPGPDVQIRVDHIDAIHALRSRPKSIDWFASSSDTDVSVIVEITDVNGRSGRRETTLGQAPAPISIEWPADPQTVAKRFELRAIGSIESTVTIFVQRMLDRNFLYKLAKGNGIEIGPGPSPQIFSASDVSVRYLEEKSAADWKHLYDQQGKHKAITADWSSYIIGTADNIPAEKESLDFIFSSHVFEHLVNPIGHLRRWRDLLRPGGLILAVVPEMNSTKDFVAAPSTLGDIKYEDFTNLWKPEISHYQRYSAARGWNYSRTSEMFGDKSSIHIHFYDLPLISALLQECVNSLGFERFEINHAPNHKDFHFALWR